MSEQPDGLQNKFRILSLLPLDRRVGRKHMAVLAFILDWHHRKYGDALASVRHIVRQLKERDPSGKGLYTGDVHSALVDLVQWGYLTQQKGSGRRASRYVPVWDIFSSVLVNPNATEVDPCVLKSPNASVRETPNAMGDSVLSNPNEDPSTQTRLKDRVTGRDIECAPPSAPLADGPVATAARTAQEGFEELWAAYNHRQRKAEARAAFNKLEPSTDMLAMMIASAGKWFSAWQAQGKPDAPRFTLAKWIEREEYECDPPTAYLPKARKPKASSHPHAEAGSSVPLVPAVVGEVSPWSPLGTFDAEITASKVTDLNPCRSSLRLTLTLSDGTETYHRFIVRSDDPAEHESGQAVFASLVAALALPGEIEDTEDMHYIPLRCTIGAGDGGLFITYAPTPANDNLAVAA